MPGMPLMMGLDHLDNGPVIDTRFLQHLPAELHMRSHQLEFGFTQLSLLLEQIRRQLQFSNVKQQGTRRELLQIQRGQAELSAQGHTPYRTSYRMVKRIAALAFQARQPNTGVRIS